MRKCIPAYSGGDSDPKMYSMDHLIRCPFHDGSLGVIIPVSSQSVQAA